MPRQADWPQSSHSTSFGDQDSSVDVRNQERLLIRVWMRLSVVGGPSRLLMLHVDDQNRQIPSLGTYAYSSCIPDESRTDGQPWCVSISIQRFSATEDLPRIPRCCRTRQFRIPNWNVPQWELPKRVRTGSDLNWGRGDFLPINGHSVAIEGVDSTTRRNKGLYLSHAFEEGGSVPKGLNARCQREFVYFGGSYTQRRRLSRNERPEFCLTRSAVWMCSGLDRRKSGATAEQCSSMAKPSNRSRPGECCGFS